MAGKVKMKYFTGAVRVIQIAVTGLIVVSLMACALPHYKYKVGPSVLEPATSVADPQKKQAPPKAIPKAEKVTSTKPQLSGRSYVVKGIRHHILATAEGFEEGGISTWYGPGFHGRKTASGEIFNQNKLTAAHKTLPLGSIVEVTNKNNGQKVVVRINDRGPFGPKKYIIDLSQKAARSIGIEGIAPVYIKVLPKETF